MTSPPLLVALLFAVNVAAAAEVPPVPPPPAAPPAAGAPVNARDAGPSGATNPKAAAKARDAARRAAASETSDSDDVPTPQEATRRTGDWPAKASGKTVTLEGAMTIDQALGKIAAAGGWNLVSTSGPDGAKSLTLRLHRVPVEEALEAVLQGTSLVAQRRGSIVTVTPGAPGVRAPGARGAAPDDRTFDPAKSAKQLRKAARERARELKRQQRAERGGKGDRVGRGDQVVKTGESAEDVVVLGGNVQLEAGAKAQEVVAVIGSVEIGPGATVESDVVAVGGDIHLMPGAHVGGDAVSVGGKVTSDVGAVIDGEQTSVDVPGLAQVLSIIGARPRSIHESRALSFASLLARFAVFFGVAMLLMSVAPRRMENLTAALSNAPVKTAVTGVLGTLAIPIAAILLAVTIIGIPLIAVLILAVILAVAMGYSALALFVGRAVPLRVERARTALQLAIGTAVILLLGAIPVFGAMVWVAGWLFVIGVIWRTRFGRPVVAPAPTYGTTPPPPTMPPPMPPTEPPVPPAPPASPAAPGAPVPPAPPAAPAGTSGSALAPEGSSNPPVQTIPPPFGGSGA